MALFLIPSVVPTTVLSSVTESKEWTQNAFFEDHLKFAELSMYSQSKQGETQSPQTIYHTNVSDDEGSSVLPVGGPMNSSWPMSCHDLHHTSQSPYSTASNHGAEIWRFSCGIVDGGPVIAKDGTIYFGDKTYPTYLYALNPNGTLKWRYQLADIWVWSIPAIAEDGTVYVGDFEGNFYAINSDGNLRWHYHIPDPGGNSIASSPAIAPDGTIYFGAMMSGHFGYIYAMNPDGSLKWRYLTGDYVDTDPAIGPDGSIYIGSCDHYLYAMNPNGTLKWRFLTGDIVKSHPSIASDGTIYFTAFDNTMYALNPDGTLKWSFGYGGSGTSVVPIASDGTLYVAGDVIYALYPNGTVRWRFAFMGDEYVDHSSPAISADGTIYVGTSLGEGDGGYIVAVNPNGTERWRKLIATYVCRSSPAIASDGTVYIGSSSIDSSPYGFLHAFSQGPIQVDAGGPYSGEPNTAVQFQCNVLGGEPPYTYLWSFGDGSTSTTKNPTHIYIQSGSYHVTLTAMDREGNSSSNSTTVLINTQPDTPVIRGSSQGKIKHNYTYSFVTSDPENDNVYYSIRWGDDSNTDWLGPYQSGETINLSHTWTKRGTYTISCQAKDVHGWKSTWGTLQVTMPLSYEPPRFRFLDWLFERFPHAFPFLRYLLNR